VYPCRMSAKRLRVTMVILDILDLLMDAPPDDPVWGLKLCEQTGHGTGTIYPALDRLLQAGWIQDRWEEPAPADRPRRRYYEITADGRVAYQEAIAARAARRTAWSMRAQRAGGTA
jgi:PadR family transcriptional regulator PadR